MFELVSLVSSLGSHLAYPLVRRDRLRGIDGYLSSTW